MCRWMEERAGGYSCSSGQGYSHGPRYGPRSTVHSPRAVAHTSPPSAMT
jgi:hypothetical protein